MSTNPASYLQRGLRLFLGVLMLWAAVSKLANPTEFLGSINAYQLPLPPELHKTAAVVLPWVELLCGLLLVSGLWLETALVIVTGLLVFFVFATGQAWLRGLEIGCGCFNLQMFGPSERMQGLVRFLESVSFAFFRNLVLAAMAGFLLRRTLTRPVSAPKQRPA